MGGIGLSCFLLGIMWWAATSGQWSWVDHVKVWHEPGWVVPMAKAGGAVAAIGYGGALGLHTYKYRIKKAEKEKLRLVEAAKKKIRLEEAEKKKESIRLE